MMSLRDMAIVVFVLAAIYIIWGNDGLELARWLYENPLDGVASAVDTAKQHICEHPSARLNFCAETQLPDWD